MIDRGILYPLFNLARYWKKVASEYKTAADEATAKLGEYEDDERTETLDELVVRIRETFSRDLEKIKIHYDKEREEKEQLWRVEKEQFRDDIFQYQVKYNEMKGLIDRLQEGLKKVHHVWHNTLQLADEPVSSPVRHRSHTGNGAGPSRTETNMDTEGSEDDSDGMDTMENNANARQNASVAGGSSSGPPLRTTPRHTRSSHSRKK